MVCTICRDRQGKGRAGGAVPVMQTMSAVIVGDSSLNHLVLGQRSEVFNLKNFGQKKLIGVAVIAVFQRANPPGVDKRSVHWRSLCLRGLPTFAFQRHAQRLGVAARAATTTRQPGPGAGCVKQNGFVEFMTLAGAGAAADPPIGRGPHGRPAP